MSEAFVPQGQASLAYGVTPTAVATLTNVEFSGSTGEVDYTNNDSPLGTSEFIPGLRDLGSITADFVANSTNASILHSKWVAKTIEDWVVTYWTSGFSKDVSGFVSEFSINAELTGESVVEGSITIKIKAENV